MIVDAMPVSQVGLQKLATVSQPGFHRSGCADARIMESRSSDFLDGGQDHVRRCRGRSVMRLIGRSPPFVHRYLQWQQASR